MNKPVLYLVVGLPGSGKTTKAMEIESGQDALRLTPDEHILKIYGHDLDQERQVEVRDEVEDKLWQKTKRALQNDQNVVIDFGFWSKAERAKFRQEAEELGAAVKIVYCKASTNELWHRISKRPESKNGTLKITRADLEEWAKIFEPPTEEELK